MNSENNTIVAVSTPPGSGGIAVIRMSGAQACEILSKAWRGKDCKLFSSHSVHLGWIIDERGEDIDQVMACFFKGPKSYTGEDVVEISCHGSLWIQQAIVNRLIECGAKAAGAGEFTRRAFINGRLDLAQAEGVADMIAATSKATAKIAASQLRGDFSRRLSELRNKLIDIGSLLELELDFSEEDVEFADRSALINLAKDILSVVGRLASSYKAGNAFKSGVPVAIVGVPNAGKSTLLNTLVGEEKAIVTEVAGTTRDIIEDTVEINGILFRFFDTAGLRQTGDLVENIGIERARKKMEEAFIVLCLIDPSQNVDLQLQEIGALEKENLLYLFTKSDIFGKREEEGSTGKDNHLMISAKTGDGIDELKEKLVALSTADFNPQHELIVTNARHYEALKNACEPLQRLIDGLEKGISADFLAQDLREVEQYLGSVTGEVSSEEILHTIFARYCIGK